MYKISVLNTYRLALERAKADLHDCRRRLKECSQMHEALEIELGRLRAAVFSLSQITGSDFVDEEVLGLTDAVRLAFKLVPGRWMTAQDVRTNIAALGFDLLGYSNILASIHTIIKRLQGRHEISSGRGTDGTTVHRWIPRLQAHEPSAFRGKRASRVGKPQSQPTTTRT